MLRLIIRQARPGMILARSIVNPRQPELTLLSAGYTLDSVSIARLHELGVYDIWIHYPGLDFLDDLFSPQLSNQQQILCESLKSCFHDQAERSEVVLPIRQYQHIIEDMVQMLLESADTMPFMSSLTSVDDALLRHSTEVCVLGLMLGLRLEGYLVEQRKRVDSRYAKDVCNLGMGCMLHDIGELKMPETERESRRGSVLDLDNQSWRKHVQLGHAMVHGQVEPSAATIVLNHHQHFDGSGFPAIGPGGDVQAGSQIHVFSRIAMAADTFQHVLHDGGIARPSVCALWQIQQEPIRCWFDPVILASLLSVVPAFMPGMVVTLSDRRQAIVTHVHEGAPCFPEVQVLEGDLMSKDNLTETREKIDLSQEPRLHIAAVDGYPVADYLYGPRRSAAGRSDSPYMLMT